VTGKQGRRHRNLLDDLKERRGYSHFKEEALDCTMWRARVGRSFGPVVRQTTKLMNEYIYIYIHSFLYFPLDENVRSALCSGCFNPEKRPLYRLNGKLCRLHSRSGRFGEEKDFFLLSTFQLHIVQSVV
jgi:hypothetical protein